MKQGFKNFIWDEKKQTIRGSNVLYQITLTILILVVVGAFVPSVADNLKKMEVIIGAVFGFSISAYSYRKVKECKPEIKEGE